MEHLFVAALLGTVVATSVLTDLPSSGWNTMGQQSCTNVVCSLEEVGLSRGLQQWWTVFVTFLVLGTGKVQTQFKMNWYHSLDTSWVATLQFQSGLSCYGIACWHAALLPSHQTPLSPLGTISPLVPLETRQWRNKRKFTHSEREETKQVVETWPSFMRSNSFIVIKHYNTVYIHKKTL